MAGGEFLTRINPFSGGGGAGLMDTVVAILLGVMALSLCAGFLFWFFKKRKAWNIKVEFRFPRDIQKIKDEEGKDIIIGTIKKEWGKGYYNGKEGIVYVKRKKKPAIPMKPFNIKEFLSESNILTVIQTGVEDYRPVKEDGYLMAKEYGTNKECAVIEAKIDTSESKAWKKTYERDRKAVFSLGGWLHEHGQLLGFGFILFTIIVGFAIVISRIQ